MVTVVVYTDSKRLVRVCKTDEEAEEFITRHADKATRIDKEIVG